MARRIINLRYPATCRDCGAPLQEGDQARYYGRGRVYGVTCHAQKAPRLTAEQRARQEVAAGTDAFMKAHGQYAFRPSALAVEAADDHIAEVLGDNVVALHPNTHIETCDGDSVVVPDEFDEPEADPADCFDAGDFDDDEELPL